MKRLTGICIVVLALAFTAAASGESEYWTCGPGPSVEAHAVAGGMEVTSIPAGARRLKVRIEPAPRRHRRYVRLHAPFTLPLTIPAATGELVSVLATGKWTKAEPYPPLGCPQGPFRAL